MAVIFSRFIDVLGKLQIAFLLPLFLLGYLVVYFASSYSVQHLFAEFSTTQFFTYLLVGIGAQLIDGALGMAYGVSASTFLMSVGVSPAAASAAVHISEVFTTAVSGISHFRFKNVNKKLFRAMVIPGVLGAVVGAYILTAINGDFVKPLVSVYLIIMGIAILRKALRRVVPREKFKHVGLLAMAGGFLDSIGGGGWGPVVTSTLLGKGRSPQYTIGTVNATEFFVTFASASVFTMFMGVQNISVIAGLIIGGIIAAPFGALVVGKVSPKKLMVAVGVLIIALSLRNLINFLPL